MRKLSGVSSDSEFPTSQIEAPTFRPKRMLAEAYTPFSGLRYLLIDLLKS